MLPALLLAGLPTAPPAALQDELTLPAGFLAERLYSVPPEQGSWVALCFDGNGIAYASDEHGPLYRIDLGTTPLSPRVEALELPIDAVQGLCADQRSGALYALVSGSKRFANGLYRLTDTNSDRRPDRVECLRAIESDRAHGLHSIVLGPEPALYLTSGVGAAPPAEALAKWGPSFLPVGRLPIAVQSVDLIGEPRPCFPSGWIARTDLDGKDWDLVAVGLCEPRDLGFWGADNPCLVDSDPPQERGLPWSLPARLLRLHERGDYGFRPGSARWRAWFPDSVPGVLELEPCEPVGLLGGLAGFPEPYQDALFVGDRLGGRILAFRKATGREPVRMEVFASGRPLPVADLANGGDGGLHDGGLYFVTGGGGAASELWRIRPEARPPPAEPSGGSFSPLGPSLEFWRRRFRELAERGKLLAGDREWANLPRSALESLPLAEWSEWVASEPDPHIRATLELACARVAPPERLRELLERLAARSIDLAERQLALSTLRTLELALLRAAPVEPATRAQLAEALLALFPTNDPDLDRQLGVLLASLPEAEERFVPQAVTRAVRGTEPAEALEWAFLVRRASAGWSSRTRRQLFNWLYGAELTFGGGRALPATLASLCEDLAAGLSPEERIDLGPLAESPPELEASTASTRHFVEAWSVEALAPGLAGLGARDAEKGRVLPAEARCLACHRVEGRGGTSGPELRGLGARYRPAELLERLLHPPRTSDEVWRDSILTTRDGRRHIGRVVGGDDQALLLRERYEAQALVRIPRDTIEMREASPLSPMPEGLLDVLTRDEVLDLLAFLLR